jgi:hypothetical protein
MMMNCMNTGTGALTVAGVRLADVALTLTGLLLVLLAVIALLPLRGLASTSRIASALTPRRRW